MAGHEQPKNIGSRRNRLLMFVLVAALIGSTIGAVRDSAGAVANGTSETHPAVVRLLLTVGDSGYACSGAIIAPTKVLTAAHCVDPIRNAPDDSLTSGNLLEVFNQGTKRLVLEKPVVMPGWLEFSSPGFDVGDRLATDPSLSFDFAVLTLSGEFPNADILPLLPTNAARDAFVGGDATLFGHGLDENDRIRVDQQKTPDGTYKANMCNGTFTVMCFVRVLGSDVEVRPGDSGAPWMGKIGGDFVQVAVHHGAGPDIEIGNSVSGVGILNFIRGAADIPTAADGDIVNDGNKSFLVTPDLFRSGIPNAATLKCLQDKGHKIRSEFNGALTNTIPETTSASATCQSPDSGDLSVSLKENPFTCDGESRSVGTISGAQPGETVRLTSAGLTLPDRVATNGSFDINWQCQPVDANTAWQITATGLTSGRDATFTITGAAPVDTGVGKFEKIGSFEIRQPDGTVAGTPVTFSYTARNTGTASLTASVFSVPIRTPSGAVADVECAGGRNVTLQPGESFSCVATRAGLNETGMYEAWADWRSVPGQWHQGELGDLRTFSKTKKETPVEDVAPTAPINVNVTPGDGKLTVSWDVPADPGTTPITMYTVREGGDSGSSCSTSGTSCELDGLVNGQSYTVRVTASNETLMSTAAKATGVPARPGPAVHEITVRARGEEGVEHFEVRVGDEVVGEATTTHEYVEYKFKVAAELEGDLTVDFTNDFYDGFEIDRNLWVDYVKVGTKTYESESAGTYSEGAWTTGYGCSPGFRQSERITCGGIFTYAVLKAEGPAADAVDPYLPEDEDPSEAASKHTVRVRAKGETGGERFALRIGSEIIAQVPVTTKWRTYRFKLDELPTGKLVVGFMNDSDDGYNDFNLHVDFVRVDNDRYESDSEGTYMAGPGTGSACVSGHRQSEVLYCSSAFFYADL